MYLNNLTLTLEPWPWQFRLCFLWTVWSPLDPGPNKWPLRWRGCCWTVWPFDLCQSSTQSGSPPDTHWSPAENKLANLNLAIFILQWSYLCSTTYINSSCWHRWGGHWGGRKLELFKKTLMSEQATTILFHIQPMSITGIERGLQWREASAFSISLLELILFSEQILVFF